MKNLIEKAKEKGFNQKKDILFEYYEEKEAQLMWMCLLQKWLRDEHDVYVEVDRILQPDIGYFHWYCWNEKTDLDYSGIGAKTYEQALEEALTKALELLK